MKAWSALSAKRLTAGAVAGVGVVALLGGCGLGTHEQAAAVVNGDVIAETDVRETTEQLQAAGLQFSEEVVVTGLIAAPLLEEQVSKSGSWQPDQTYAAVMAEIPDATEATEDFVAAVALLDANAMTEADVKGYREALESADIEVNPKYGTFQAVDQGPVFFVLSQEPQNWIVEQPTGQPAQ